MADVVLGVTVSHDCTLTLACVQLCHFFYIFNHLLLLYSIRSQVDVQSSHGLQEPFILRQPQHPNRYLIEFPFNRTSVSACIFESPF